MEGRGPQQDSKQPLRCSRPLGAKTPLNLRKATVKVNIVLQESKIKTLSGEENRIETQNHGFVLVRKDFEAAESKH